MWSDLQAPTGSAQLKRQLRIQIADLVILLILLVSAAYLAQKIRTNIHYTWNWGIIWQYFVRFDPQSGQWVPNLLLNGLLNTVRLSFWAIILASVFGAVFGLFRVSASLFKRLIAAGYVETIRNLPPIVLVFIFYFFISDQIMPLLGLDDLVRSLPERIQNFLAIIFAPAPRFSAFASAVLALALYEGSYVTEIARAGIQSIEKGQWEASYALGLSWWQQMRHVILPQALKRVLPPLAGQFISTIKDSAILSVISIQELTFQGMELMAATYHTFEIWIAITVMYFVLTFGCSLALRRLENYSRKTP